MYPTLYDDEDTPATWIRTIHFWNGDCPFSVIQMSFVVVAGAPVLARKQAMKALTAELRQQVTSPTFAFLLVSLLSPFFSIVCSGKIPYSYSNEPEQTSVKKCDFKFPEPVTCCCLYGSY